MKTLLASLLLLAAAAGQAPQPAPQPAEETVKPEDRCSVEGTVVNLQTGDPLKKAHVKLAPAGKFNATVFGAVTDSAGHFVIEDVNPGKYTFSAERNGFVNSEYGSKGPGKPGTQLTLTRGQKLKDVVFKMIPHAVISGKVVDEDGEPLAGARVMVVRSTYMNGKKTLATSASAMSDDRGDYRAHGLAPGKYYVYTIYDRGGNMMQQVEIRKEGPQDGYAPTFYPSSPSAAQASVIDVAPGVEVNGIDFRLNPVHTAHISGTVTNAMPGQTASVMLVGRDGGLGWNNMKHAIADDKGKFMFHNIAPGSYSLTAQTYAVGSEPQVAQGVVEVGDSNVEGVQLTFGAGRDIPGTVTALKGVDLKGRGLTVGLMPEGNVINMGNPGGQVLDDGTFKLRLITPDVYRLSLYPMPDGCYIKTIRYGDSEYPGGVIDLSKGAGGEFSITIAPNAAQMDGNVKDAKDQPATSATVVLVPDQRDLHSFYSVANTDQNGHFTLKGLRPGKYKLFAWDEVQWGQFEDPDFIKPFEEKGEAIELSEGDKSSKDLKLIVTGDVTGVAATTNNQ